MKLLSGNVQTLFLLPLLVMFAGTSYAQLIVPKEVPVPSQPKAPPAPVPAPTSASSTGTEGGFRNPPTEAAHFTALDEGVIADSQTGLEWIVGPDKDINYAQAEQWVAACNVAGGGWRMPTRQELGSLYEKGVGDRNMDPSFKTTGWRVWAEPRDSSSAWSFVFGTRREGWDDRGHSYLLRVFGVRSRPRSNAGVHLPPVTPSAASPGKGTYAIQAASFSGAKRKEVAEQYKKRLATNAGIEADLIPSEDDKTLRVLVGSYPDKESAMRACEELKKRAGFTDSFVRQR